MKAIILAAGVGSRLYPVTKNVPKCLVVVKGKSILQWQLEQYLDAGINEIIVVAGYLKEQVRAMIQEKFFGKPISIIENNEYRTTNNMYSLYLCIDKINGGFLLSNGDVVFDETIINDLVKAPNGNYICCQAGTYDKESMKVVYDHNTNRISNISKTIDPSNAYGNSIDLYRFNKTGSQRLFSIINDIIINQNNMNSWTEVAIDSMLSDIPVEVFDIGKRRWKEIDTLTDLDDAKGMFGDYAYD